MGVAASGFQRMVTHCQVNGEPKHSTRVKFSSPWDLSSSRSVRKMWVSPCRKATGPPKSAAVATMAWRVAVQPSLRAASKPMLAWVAMTSPFAP